MAASLDLTTKLFPSLASTWERALASRTVITYPSELTLFPDTPHDDLTRIPWRIRCVPALGDKAKAKAASKTTGEASAAVDVFAPPYHADLLVHEGREFVVLLNKFAIVSRHFLLVTRGFESQKLPPSPRMLALVYRILLAHAAASDTTSGGGKKHGSELLAFYNCGEMSGASQPHAHVQFVECELEAEEKEAEQGTGRIPIERLLAKCRDVGGKDDAIFALPLPYQHFVALLAPPSSDDEEALEAYMSAKLLGLLDALFKAKHAATEKTDSTAAAAVQERPGPPSWNLLVTKRALHLIPRSKETFTLNVEGEKRELSINSMAYAGHLLTKSKAELEALKQLPGGVRAVLQHTGCPGVEDVTMMASDSTVESPTLGQN